jgi:signal transduction histidine kinase
MNVVVATLLAGAGIAVSAAVALGFRSRSERAARERAERRARDLETRDTSSSSLDREWLRVLAHEMRTPIGAILGYGELLSDGTFGALQPPAADAIRRVRSAADQMLALVEGLDEADDGVELRPARIAAGSLLAAVVNALGADADARDVRITVQDGGVSFATDADRAARTLRLALGAAIKASSGVELHVTARASPVPSIVIGGAQFDPHLDVPGGVGGSGRTVTGAGLRIELARRAARRIHGTVQLDGTPAEPQLQITLPPLAIDGSEQTP